MISMMKPMYNGSGKLPAQLSYKEPKKPSAEFSKETEELYLYAEMDYIAVKDGLKIFNREPVPVSIKNNFKRKLVHISFPVADYSFCFKKHHVYNNKGKYIPSHPAKVKYYF